MIKTKTIFKVGNHIILNIEESENIKYKFGNKAFEVISLTEYPEILIGRHINLTSHLKADKFRLATEKEIKEYKIKNVFQNKKIGD